MATEACRQVRVDELIRAGVLALNDGYRVRNVELGPIGIPFVRGGDIGDGSINTNVADRIRPEFSHRVQSKLTKPWDVAFITKGTVGRVGILRPNQPQSVFAPQVCYWRSLDHTRLAPRFLFYLLSSSAFQGNLDAVKTHGSMAADYVSLSDQRSFYVAVPEIDEQRAISDLLGALDDRIDLLRQTNATLEAIAQALFKSWFVDFDPVRAKAEGREPDGMDPATAALFPSEFEQSELGLIPKGWAVDEIGKVAPCVGGATPSTKEPRFWGDPVHHWVTPKDLSGLQSPVLTDTDRKVSQAGLAKISSGLLPVGTVLLSSRAPIGYLAIAHIPTAINQGFIAMLPGGKLPPSYLLFWTKLSMGAIKQKANGSTFMEISKSAFRPMELVVAPPQVVSQFDSISEPLLDRVAENEKTRRQLAEIRDTLLPRLISGKLRLPEVEKAIEEAVA